MGNRFFYIYQLKEGMLIIQYKSPGQFDIESIFVPKFFFISKLIIFLFVLQTQQLHNQIKYLVDLFLRVKNGVWDFLGVLYLSQIK